MKDEIKEILDDLRTYKDRYEYFLFNNLSFSDRDYKAKILLDYITNLQEIRKEHSIMKQFIYENGLWEKFLNDNRFLEHLRSDDNVNITNKKEMV